MSTITIVNQDSKISRMTMSDASGRFLVQGLVVGRYRVTTSLSGYWPLAVEELTLALGDESISTSASRLRRLRITSTSSAKRRWRSANAHRAPTSSDRIASPSCRSTAGACSTSPRWRRECRSTRHRSRGPRELGVVVPGQRGRSNNIQVDGLDNNDETVGAVRALFSQEGVREFQVISGSPSAEFGAASGGVVNVVTKSGGDILSGSLFGFFRDKALNSKGYFEQHTPSGTPIDMEKAPYNQWQVDAPRSGVR